MKTKTVGSGMLAQYTFYLAVAAGMVCTPALAEPWDIHAYLENDTHYRGEDAQKDSVGLSKVRNTIQASFKKPDLLGGWEFYSVLRGTYDGVYELNKTEYGRHQGGPIELQSTPVIGSDAVTAILDLLDGLGGVADGGAALTATSVPHGGGLSVGFLSFNSDNPNAPNYNPNEGLQVLGHRWHKTNNGGVEFGTPVRPCNVDKRGCVDFGGYGDKDSGELASPEFNSRLDFLREITVSNSFEVGDAQEIFIKVGKQQIVWGRTDLFRVLDVINPVDYSRNNIYDELEDIRYPMWIAQAEYRMGALSFLSDANIQFVWNFDRFRADNIGQCGTPTVILNAGCFFRGMKNLWDNGGTVANFAHLTPDAFVATDFGPGQIGLRDVKLPKWNLANTQYGVKLEGVTGDGMGFSINALNYRSQLPALHGARTAQNSFTGVEGQYPYLIAFDMVFPRVQMLGGSIDMYLESVKSALRVEVAMTKGEQYADTSKPDLYSEHKVFRSVVGMDHLAFIPFISRTRTSLFSGQLFFQHLFNHNLEKNELGQVGMPDWENNVIATLLIKSWIKGDRISPQLIQAYDVQAEAYVVSPQVDWLITPRVKLSLGANIKTIFGHGEEKWEFDDARSTNPFPPFSGLNYPGDPNEPGSRGLSGLEPLGIFRAGPIGTGTKEDEGYLVVRYNFY